MKKAHTIVLRLLVVSCAFAVFTQCKNKPKDNPPSSEETGKITPVDLPETVPGFNFPEQESVINGWLNDTSFAGNYDSVSIYNHVWGIWAGLTDPTNQKYAGDKLLVFETWMGLGEVQDIIEAGGTACDTSYGKTHRTPLTRPKQFEHSARFAGFHPKQLTGVASEDGFSQWVTVSYSPEAACFSTKNQIFKQSVINRSYVENGYGAIPQFPNSAITIKPTYLVYKDTNELLQVPVWLDAPNPPDSFSVNRFPYCVYVDMTNKQKKDKKLKPVLTNVTDAKAIEEATCNLDDFIYFKVDAKMAALMNHEDSVQGLSGAGGATAGQIALLVGMHVTTKEISNWTWQTYYWTPNPENPGTPSSELAVKTRPKQLKGAAGHYAAVAAYAMLLPNGAQNNTKGAMELFGYNPYLEGGFGPNTFSLDNKFKKDFQYGQQTNCMSCHILALPSPAAQYGTDQFIDTLDPSLYKNQVRLDFAWSIQTALINDTVPYWQFKK